MSLVYMFPGQNSRYPEMIERLRSFGGCDRVLREASDILGRDISAQYRPHNPQMFSRNRDVQVGVFLAGYIHSRQLAAEGFRPEASLGLSLGEYNHLVEIGALSFAEALRLLDARGCAYENGPKGIMMSVFPCDAEQVLRALAATAAFGSADVGIELSSNHFVLSGETGAVQAAATWLEAEEYAQTRVIDAVLPMHSRVFRPAAEAFRAALQETRWLHPAQGYLPNAHGCLIKDATPADFEDRLYRHVFNTVRWAQSMDNVAGRFPDASYVEVGPRSVLYNSVRREYKHLRCFRIDDPESAAPVFPNTIRELRGLHHAV